MKKIICLLIISIFLLCPLGCSIDNSTITLQFYYPRQNYGYDALDGRFYSQSATEELRKDIPYHSARQVIGVYLQGPADPLLVNPFPKGTELVDLTIEENKLYLTLTDQLSELSGIPLIMACSCLARTAMTLTKVSEVRIRCESTLLDGESTVVIAWESVFYDDPIIS